MKQYKMATINNPSIVKQPLKLIEIPLNKFSEEVIPHYQKMLEQHQAFIHKLISADNKEQLAKEIKDKRRSIKQLRDLLYELDTLRTQVEDKDLDAFDTRTMPLRSSILKLTKSYQELEKTVEQFTIKGQTVSDPSLDERYNPFEGASHIQIQTNLEDLKLQEEQAKLHRVQEIQKKSEDLQEIHKNLHQLVSEQGEQVNEAEVNISSTQENVHSGFRDIVKAHKLTAVAYPATGAVVGTLLGGPIGLVAGLKVGSIAAIGCAFAGYAGGNFLKKQRDIQVSNDADHIINNENNENHSTVSEKVKKET